MELSNNLMPTSKDPSLPSLQLSAADRRRKEHRRRRRELIIAVFAFILVLILTSFQLEQFRTGDRLFVAMFNVNFLLLLGIAIIVFRNTLKLFFERRRNVLGSRLRSRLVLAFVGLSLLPCLLMFLVTTKYVQLSMDFWFKEQVETSMEMALDVTRASFDKAGSDLTRQSNIILTQVQERKLGIQSRAINALLRQKQLEYGLTLAGIAMRNGTKAVWNSDDSTDIAWSVARETINWDAVDTQGTSYTLIPGFMSDYIISTSIYPGKQGYYLIFATDMGAGYKAKIDRVVKGAGEYKSLRNIKKPLKLLLYSSLGVLTALIILGALWFAFRLAREISAPVMAVAAGTERIAKGDLSVRLQDSSEDEFGVLIRSFNKMAKDLETSRAEVTGINFQLEKQNIKTARHNKYIETVLNNIAAGVISFDSQGNIVTLNKAASEILMMLPTGLVGKRAEDVLAEPYATMAQSIRNRLSQRLDGRINQTITLPFNGEDRRLLANIVGFSTDGVYSGAVAVFEDISEIERMQRLAAWREVAKRIAHEIKNPLTPIKLSAQRLARKFGSQVEDPAFIQSTTLIVKQVEHLQRMVQEFSAFAKLPEVKPKPDHIEPLLQSLTDLFKNSHSGIRWDLSCTPSLPLVAIDKDSLSRAFMNLYTNAAEALATVKIANPAVSVVVTCDDKLKLIRIDVADNGPGLTEEDRAQLFEPYFTRKKGGSGLGLTIVRSIVADHRGYVRALARKGGGTVISVEIPVSAI